MSEIPGSEQILDVDLVFIAAGFLGSEEYVTKEFAVKCNGPHKCADEAGRIQHQPERNLYSGRYAPWTVLGCLGNPRGKRGSP